MVGQQTNIKTERFDSQQQRSHHDVRKAEIEQST